MKIAIDVSDLNYPYWDGTRVVEYNVLKNLAKVDKANKYFLYFQGEPTDKIEGVKQKNFQFKVSYFPKFWTQLRLPIELFRDSPDVLWMPLHSLPIIRPRKMKTVVSLFDLGFIHYPKTKKFIDRQLLTRMTSYITRHADKIITISEYTKKDLIKTLKVDKKKIEVVYLGYDDKKFKPGPKNIENQKKVKNILASLKIDQPYILFVGGLNPRKNLVRLIKGFELLKSKHKLPHKLVIAGAEAWLFKETIKKAKTSKFKKDILFTGHVDDKKIVTLFREASCFAFPSILEGFGMPVLEAMASGTPVLTSNTSALPEVGGKAAYYIDPYSIKEIAMGLHKILTDNQLQKKMITKGFENAKRFSWEKTARKTLRVIKDSLK